MGDLIRSDHEGSHAETEDKQIIPTNLKSLLTWHHATDSHPTKAKGTTSTQTLPIRQQGQ